MAAADRFYKPFRVSYGEKINPFLLVYFMIIGAAVAQSVQRLGYGLDDRGSVPGRGNGGILFLRHRVQTGSAAHPAF
jgi:hypothetical protein